jgi:hypothetical protein
MAALYLFSAFTWFFVKPPRVGGQGAGVHE